jgi:hypothetical protein
MTNVFLGVGNCADSATLAGGSYDATLVRNNLKTSNISKVAQTSTDAVADTRFRFDLTANYALRALAIRRHNMSSAGLWRVKLGTAALDLPFESREVIDDRLTTSGGANGTRVNSSGVIVAATCPRIDYHPVTLACRGLLIEEARTNFAIRAGELDNASWSKLAGTTIGVNAVTAPDGATTAEKIIEANANSTHGVFQTLTVVNGTTYTQSGYMKAAERTWGYMTEGSGATSTAFFNLSTGVVGSITGTGSPTSAIAAAGNSWHSTSLTWTAIGTSANIQFRPSTANGTASYAGNGTSGIYGWGGQLEAGAFRTSYIPTTTAAVTRTADSATITSTSFSDAHSATGGALYYKGASPGIGTRPLIAQDDNTANERIELYTSGTDLKFRVIDGGATQCDITIGTIVANTVFQVAVRWAANDFAGSLNGAAAVTDTAGTLPTVDRMRLGSDQAGNFLCEHIERVAKWRTTLTNAQLQAITTSGPDIEDVGGYDSGWQSVLEFAFKGDTPSDWGLQYDLMVAFDEITARYGTVEFDDTENTAGYLQFGRLWVGDGLQPAAGAASEGHQEGRNDLSTMVTAMNGKKFGIERPRRRWSTISFPVLTQAEADKVYEMLDDVGLLGEVLYIPDPADMPRSQRYGGIGELSELTPLDFPVYDMHSTGFRWEEKL